MLGGSVGENRLPMTLLPFKPAVEQEAREPAVIDFSEDPDQIFAALQSETARMILVELYDEPAVASELTDRVDTSLQNIQYHLENLCEAGVVEVVDVGYSSKGNEMKIYAPSGESLTIVVGSGDWTEECRRAVTR